MKYETSIGVQLVFLFILQQTALSSCEEQISIEANYCSFYCIVSIFTTIGSFIIICIGCTCCVFVAFNSKRLFGDNAVTSGIIRSQINDAEVGTQYNHIAANPAADPQASEPTLNYDDVISMDSLPPHIPGYTYNANNPIIQEVPANNLESITPQNAVFSIELFADLPFPPPYLTITGNDTSN